MKHHFSEHAARSQGRRHGGPENFGFSAGPAAGDHTARHRGHERHDGGPRGHGGPGGRGFGPGGPRGRGGRPGRGEDVEPTPVSTEAITAWLAGRLPDDWFTGPAELSVDRDEITVIGTLSAPDVAAGADAPAVAEAEAGRITRFREATRDERVAIAREIEHRYGRALAWGARSGDTTSVFTNRSVPVMTRLRQPERQVLDTLVDAGVARSRSDALAWCVRLVGRHSDNWLADLREAMSSVERIRDLGPDA